MVITAVVVEGRSQSEVAREYGVSQGWISRLVKRYRLEGEAAFEPQSRRPRTSPTRLAQATVDLIIELRSTLSDARTRPRPAHHRLAPATSPRRDGRAATIHRHLRAAGLITPAPQKRPKSSYIRFAAEQPNERWQADFTHWWLADGTPKSSTWLDDHARYALSVTAHRRVTGPIVLTDSVKPLKPTVFRPPHSPTTAWSSPPACPAARADATISKTNCAAWASPRSTPPRITRPPAARSNASTKPSKRGSPANPNATTIAELQTQLDAFVDEYNHHRPHRSLPHRATPATAYQARPKAAPANPRRHPRPRPHRPRRPSRLHHPARRRATAPHRRRPHPLPNPRPDPRPGPQHQNHQRRHRRTPPRAHPRPHQGLPTHRSTQRPHTEKAPNLMKVRNYSDVLRHHMVAGTGFEPATSGL